MVLLAKARDKLAKDPLAKLVKDEHVAVVAALRRHRKEKAAPLPKKAAEALAAYNDNVPSSGIPWDLLAIPAIGVAEAAVVVASAAVAAASPPPAPDGNAAELTLPVGAVPAVPADPDHTDAHTTHAHSASAPPPTVDLSSRNDNFDHDIFGLGAAGDPFGPDSDSDHHDFDPDAPDFWNLDEDLNAETGAYGAPAAALEEEPTKTTTEPKQNEVARDKKRGAVQVDMALNKRRR